MIKSSPIRTVGIIGAGPSGLSMAYFLRAKSLKIEVIESSSHIGGLAQTFSLWNRQIELGAHFLAYDECEAVKSILENVFDNHELILYNRKTSILKAQGQKFSYPPNFQNLLANFTFKQLALASISYMSARFRKISITDAREALIKQFGDYLYYFFFHDYSVKLWGKSCKELDPCFSQAMLPFRNKRTLWSNIKKKKNRVVYFENGLNELWKRIYDQCIAHNVIFRLNNSVKQFQTYGKKIKIVFHDGRESTYDKVISTLPDSINRVLFGLPQEQTYHYRDLILVYLKVNQNHLLDGQCLYIYRNDTKVARLVDFSHFPNANSTSNIFLLEYWTDPNGLSNVSDKTLMETVHKDLKELKFKFSYEDFHIKRIPKAYRIPEMGYANKIASEKNDFDSDLFVSIGRGNSPFFNYGMDNAIMEAHELSKKF